MSSSQWESVPVGSEEVTEAVDFWLVNTGGTSAATCSSSSSSIRESLEESRVTLTFSPVSSFFNKEKSLRYLIQVIEDFYYQKLNFKDMN